jgi:hypothetical protein
MRNSREVARAAIRRNYIVPYIDALAEMLFWPVDADLVINMDKSGFISQLLKGICKSALFFRI